MQIIIHGNRDYQKFFSLTPEKGRGPYVPSHYMLKRETEDGVLLCSTLTGELVLLSPEEKQALDRCPADLSPVTQGLIRHRFLVPQGVREDLTVEQLRAVMMKRLEAKRVIVNYNILPTTFCNARCFYCFESGVRHVHMSNETADRLVKFIASHHGGKKVTLAWFGGEPMLGMRQIDRICRGLDRLNISYVSDMTSNGFLFDADLARHAREAWQLKSIQITLDGTREIYNRIKAYLSAGEDPYERVLRNIGLLADEGVRVRIRLNMDSHNEKDLENLIDELSDRFAGKKTVRVYVAILDEGAGFDPISHTPEEQERLVKRLSQLRDRLEEKGWPHFRAGMLPGLCINSCRADDPHSVQCTPEGILSKCVTHIYEDTVGSLEEGVTDREKEVWWRQRAPFDGCETCPLYPSCLYLLKNCPDRRTGCDTDDRRRKIAGYEALMLSKYEEWKAAGNNTEEEA